MSPTDCSFTAASNQIDLGSRAARAIISIWRSKIGFHLRAGFNRRSEVTFIRSEQYRRIMERLVQARKDAGIPQAELGRRIGRRQTFASKFELLEHRLDVAEFIAICRVLELDYHREMSEAAEGVHRCRSFARRERFCVSGG